MTRLSDEFYKFSDRMEAGYPGVYSWAQKSDFFCKEIGCTHAQLTESDSKRDTLQQPAEKKPSISASSSLFKNEWLDPRTPEQIKEYYRGLEASLDLYLDGTDWTPTNNETAYPCDRESALTADITVNPTTESANVDKYRIDLTLDYPDPQYIMEIGGIGCFPRGDIQAVKAKAKQGKTHTLLCYMVALLKGEFLSIKSKIESPTIWYFATEEHMRSAAKICKKVNYLCGFDKNRNMPNFNAASLRAMCPSERINYIKSKVEEDKPDVVFIDGVRDLLIDFNNIEESAVVIQFLMKLSEENNCSVMCVLHENKSIADKNMRGHLGTELLNKCSDTIEVRKKGDTFCVSTSDSRNEAADDWEYELDGDGLPTQASGRYGESTDASREAKRKATLMKDFGFILKGQKALSFTDLRDAWIDLNNKSEATAERHIADARKLEVIEKGSDENYRLK